MLEIEIGDEAEDNMSKFFQNFKNQINKPAGKTANFSGRVGFESGDF